MPYIKKEFKTIKGKKIEDFLLQDISLDSKLLLTLLEKGKITDENNKSSAIANNILEVSKLNSFVKLRKL